MWSLVEFYNMVLQKRLYLEKDQNLLRLSLSLKQEIYALRHSLKRCTGTIRRDLTWWISPPVVWDFICQCSGKFQCFSQVAVHRRTLKPSALEFLRWERTPELFWLESTLQIRPKHSCDMSGKVSAHTRNHHQWWIHPQQKEKDTINDNNWSHLDQVNVNITFLLIHLLIRSSFHLTQHANPNLVSMFITLKSSSDQSLSILLMLAMVFW